MPPFYGYVVCGMRNEKGKLWEIKQRTKETEREREREKEGKKPEAALKCVMSETRVRVIRAGVTCARIIARPATNCTDTVAFFTRVKHWYKAHWLIHGYSCEL